MMGCGMRVASITGGSRGLGLALARVRRLIVDARSGPELRSSTEDWLVLPRSPAT
jgi:NAD(P)-dependent dehydrogenase (short-subunit alcohol dehydrogenase family)